MIGTSLASQMVSISYPFSPPSDVCRFARWKYAYVDIERSKHTHTFYEIFWGEKGAGWHEINGEKRPLLPGTLALIRKEDCHGFSAMRAGEFVQFCNFAFAPELWERLQKAHPGALDGAFFSVADSAKREFQLNPLQLERLRAMSKDLEEGARDALSAESFLGGVIALLLNAERHYPAMPEWLAGACNRIQSPEYFRGGTKAFVGLTRRSPEHVARETRRLLGRSPTDIVNEARMAHAAHELCFTSREIVDIAADCGIESLGHFYNLFSARFGCTPVKYRNSGYTTLDSSFAGN